MEAARGQMLLVALILMLILLSACSDSSAIVGFEQSGEGAIGPQEIEDATEVVKFDPASIPISGDPVAGACVESAIVPGSYRCDLEAGDAAEPCFPLSSARLLCDPDPVAGTYEALVSPTNSLPPIVPPSPDRAMVFFVELDDGMTCAVRTTPEPVIIGGSAASYDCNAPYTYLLGERTLAFEKAAPLWVAGMFTLDPATGESPSGKVPKDILRAWIP